MHCTHRASIVGTALLLALALLLPAAAATAAEQEWETDRFTIQLGLQGTDLSGDRPGKFFKYRDFPEGLVIPGLDWIAASDDLLYNFQFTGHDLLEEDQRIAIRAGVGPRVQLRFDWDEVPVPIGDRALTVHGDVGGALRVPDFVQQEMEDPDGNGIPFYDELDGGAADLAGTRVLTNDLLDAQGRFDLKYRRKTGSFGMLFTPYEDWTIDFEVIRTTQDGNRAMGTGTYQRIKTTNPDSYYFSFRGAELPKTMDWESHIFRIGANWVGDRAFAGLSIEFSEFDNANRGLTYDNAQWYTDTLADSGVKRGLWGEGRAALAPDNEAWNVTLTAGGDLGDKTRLTGSFSYGEHTQDEPFLPLVTNTSTIGTQDINGDGVVDAQDDPTIVDTLPSSNLDATVEITVFNLLLTSRPIDILGINARYRYYDYDSNFDPLLFPYRGYYVESNINAAFQGADVLSRPLDFTRQSADLQFIIDASDWMTVIPYFEWNEFDRDRYVDAAGGPTFSRTGGNRAVEKTEENIYGLTLAFSGSDWFNGRLDYHGEEREYKGDYQPEYSGEQPDLRQYDIANRDRDVWSLDLDFNVDDHSIGLDYRNVRDKYPDSLYGLQDNDLQGITLDYTYSGGNGLSVFAYADYTETDADMHLRVKCNNCTDSNGDLWGAWNVPGFDWFTDYEDRTTSLGAGFGYTTDDARWTFNALLNYTKGKVSQSNQNSEEPYGGAQVGTAYDFPDQESDLFSAEFDLTRKINDRWSCGFWYLYEDWSLSDFQWDVLQPYGANFVDVDDDTRFLFLDSRFTGYTANVLQFYVKLSFP